MSFGEGCELGSLHKIHPTFSHVRASDSTSVEWLECFNVFHAFEQVSVLPFPFWNVLNAPVWISSEWHGKENIQVYTGARHALNGKLTYQRGMISSNGVWSLFQRLSQSLLFIETFVVCINLPVIHQRFTETLTEGPVLSMLQGTLIHNYLWQPPPPPRQMCLCN